MQIIKKYYLFFFLVGLVLAGGSRLHADGAPEKSLLEELQGRDVDAMSESELDALAQKYDVSDDMQKSFAEGAFQKTRNHRSQHGSQHEAQQTGSPAESKKYRRPRRADDAIISGVSSGVKFLNENFSKPSHEQMIILMLIMTKKLFWFYEQWFREKHGIHSADEFTRQFNPFNSLGGLGYNVGRYGLVSLFSGILLFMDLKRVYERMKGVFSDPAQMMSMMGDPYMLNKMANDLYVVFDRAQRFIVDPEYFGHKINFVLAAILRMAPALIFADFGSRKSSGHRMHKVVQEAVHGVIYDAVWRVGQEAEMLYSYNIPYKTQKDLYHGSLGILRPEMPREILHLLYNYADTNMIRTAYNFKNQPRGNFGDYIKREGVRYVRNRVAIYGALQFLRFLFKNGFSRVILKTGGVIGKGLKALGIVSENPFDVITEKRKSWGKKLFQWFPGALGYAIAKRFSTSQLASLRTRVPDLDRHLDVTRQISLQDGVVVKGMMSLTKSEHMPGLVMPTDDAVEAILNALTPDEFETVLAGALDMITLRFFLTNDYEEYPGMGRSTIDAMLFDKAGPALAKHTGIGAVGPV